MPTLRNGADIALACLFAALAGSACAAPPVQLPYSWGSVAIGGGGFVTAVIPSRSEPGVTYARTDVGGAYRWDATARRWIPLLDWVDEDQTGYLGVDALAVDPHKASTIYLLAGIAYLNGGRSAILRSTDYGKTFSVVDVSAQFKTHGNGMGRQDGERLAVDPDAGNTLYLGSRYDGLFKSQDAGRTWTRMRSLDVTATPNGAGIDIVLPDPASKASARRLFVGVARSGSAGPNLYRSDDGGASFAPIAGAPTGLTPQRAALDGAGNLYITYANGAGPHPDRSGSEPMDRGQVWKYHIASGAWWSRPSTPTWRRAMPRATASSPAATAAPAGPTWWRAASCATPPACPG